MEKLFKKTELKRTCHPAKSPQTDSLIWSSNWWIKSPCGDSEWMSWERVEDCFELSETLIDCILTSQREWMHNSHTKLEGFEFWDFDCKVIWNTLEVFEAWLVFDMRRRNVCWWRNALVISSFFRGYLLWCPQHTPHSSLGLGTAYFFFDSRTHSLRVERKKIG